MKIGVLSDIHGNAIALEATLNEAKQVGIERLFVLGDFVGYFYNPARVFELLSEWNCSFIQGNHDYMLKEALDDSSKLAEITAKYGSGIACALEQLSTEQIQALIDLPPTRKISVNNRSFLLCHGSPWDRDEYIYADANEEKFQRCASTEVNYVLLGHTHRPFSCYQRGVAIINSGSVGQFREKGGIATWAIINTENGSVISKQTPYDVSNLVEQAKKQDPHVPYLQKVLLR